MKKLLCIAVLCSTGLSVWAQSQTDPDQFQLKLIETYMTRINDSQNVEKYVFAGSAVGLATFVTFATEPNYDISYVSSASSLAIFFALPFLFFPSGADIVHWQYSALPDNTSDQIAAKILAGDKALENLRDRSVAGKIVLGSLLCVTGLLVIGAGVIGSNNGFILGGIIPLGLGVFEMGLPSYSQLQYDEYRSKSLVSK